MGRGSDRRLSHIGPEIKRLRMARGLTQAALAAPRSRAYVCAIERGRMVPSVTALAELTSRLDVSLGEFFAGVENSSS